MEISEIRYKIGELKKRNDKKLFHLKSIENFSEYLYRDVKKNRKSNIKKIGIVRKKELLVEYLNILEKSSQPISNQQSEEFFRKYIFEIGKFMSTSYSFSFLHLYGVIFWIVPAILIGQIFDYFLNYNLRITVLAITLVTARFFVKIWRGQVFGFMY